MDFATPFGGGLLGGAKLLIKFTWTSLCWTPK